MRAAITKWAFSFAFAGVVGYALITLNGPHGVHALREKQDLIEKMQKQNATEAQRIERIKEHIKRLDQDPSEQELEIRERLKLLHPDEKVFITGEPEKRETRKR